MKETIENKINAIQNILSRSLPEGWQVKRERPVKGAVCRGILSVYSAAELKRLESPEDSGIVSRRMESVKLTPTVRYAFYAGDMNPRSLGSVAIYGPSAASICAQIQRHSTLFGQRIRSVSMELGRRPFVDVRFFE